MKRNQCFNTTNPNRENAVYDEFVEEWAHKVWLSPYRLRQNYRWEKNWKRRDWRQYQPKYEAREELDYVEGERKRWPEDYTRQERIRKTKPTWMKRWSWRQNGDRKIELRNAHQSGIGEHVDVYNYDRFRSVFDETERRDKITLPPRYGGNKRGYHH